MLLRLHIFVEHGYVITILVCFCDHVLERRYLAVIEGASFNVAFLPIPAPLSDPHSWVSTWLGNLESYDYSGQTTLVIEKYWNVNEKEMGTSRQSIFFPSGDHI